MQWLYAVFLGLGLLGVLGLAAYGLYAAYTAYAQSGWALAIQEKKESRGR